MPYRRPSAQHARRQLTRVQQALAALRSLEVSDWRERASKAENLRRLEAQERKWKGILEPPPVERFYTF